MRALTLRPEAVLDRDHPEPARAPGEALVAVRLAGVCDTDLQLARGYMGFSGVPGHEFVGTVLACDDPRWLGRRVVADINAGCGQCEDCLAPPLAGHHGHHCAKRTVLGILGRSGAFAERLTVPERALREVPDALDDARAVFAEPVAAALHVLDELDAPTRARAVVIGDGKLGLLIALALAGAGVATALVGRHPHKLAIAAAAGVDTAREAEAARLAGCDVVVDATGNAGGLATALGLVRPRGTVVLKTTVGEPVPVDLARAVVNELRLVGSRCGDMTRALAALARGAIDPRPLVEARYALDRAPDALAHAGRRGALKIVIEVEATT